MAHGAACVPPLVLQPAVLRRCRTPRVPAWPTDAHAGIWKLCTACPLPTSIFSGPARTQEFLNRFAPHAGMLNPPEFPSNYLPKTAAPAEGAAAAAIPEKLQFNFFVPHETLCQSEKVGPCRVRCCMSRKLAPAFGRADAASV